LNDQIQAKLDQLNASYTTIQSIIPGPYSPPQPPPPPPPPPPQPEPTQDELNLQAYQQSVLIRQQILDAVNVGALPSDDPLVISSQQAVMDAFSLVQQNISDQLTASQTTVTNTKNILLKGSGTQAKL